MRILLGVSGFVIMACIGAVAVDAVVNLWRLGEWQGIVAALLMCAVFVFAGSLLADVFRDDNRNRRKRNGQP